MALSFSAEIKNEIALIKLTSEEEKTELIGFARNNIKIEKDFIIFTMENPKVVRRLYGLFKNFYNITPEIIQVDKLNFNKKKLNQLIIKENIPFILKDLMILNNNKFIVSLDEEIIASEELTRAYLRGVFLATGSINDPKKASYHLEFLIDNEEEATFVMNLLNKFYLGAKLISRDKGYMVYIKESEKIGDFLRIIYASRAVMYFEDIRIYRDHKNMTNRFNNCEQANMDKTIEAANKQLEDINIIVNKLGLDLVEDKRKEVIVYRKKYPDISLLELSEIITLETGKNITKSGLNHRMRKIKELAAKLKED